MSVHPPPLKRSRAARDMSRPTRLREASVALFRKPWLRAIAVAPSEEKVEFRADGTFAFTVCAMKHIEFEHVRELVDAVSTPEEPAYIRFEALDSGRMRVSVETTYPPESAMRRENRKNDANVWYRHLDIEDRDAGRVKARVVWSNELMDVPQYGRNTLMVVAREVVPGPNMLQFVPAVKP